MIFALTVCQQTDHTTSRLPQFTQIKRLLFLLCSTRATQASLQVYRFSFFFSWASLIYRPLFPHARVPLCPLSFLYLRLPPFSHPACCLEESLQGPLTERTGSIVPKLDHRAAGSARAAFIVFRLCPVIKGYSVILALNASKDAGEAAGECR